MAYEIAALGGIYCGPAAVAWIAAVWNRTQGRRYDVKARLLDKALFPDGPRRFRGRFPLFQDGLHETLVRETEGELGLSRSTYFRIKSLHRALAEDTLPIVLRMRARTLRAGLHYTVLVESKAAAEDADKLRLRWMDNGHYGLLDPGHPAYYTSSPRRPWGIFPWACKRVVRLTADAAQ